MALRALQHLLVSQVGEIPTDVKTLIRTITICYKLDNSLLVKERVQMWSLRAYLNKSLGKGKGEDTS